ncbi:MAG: TatD family deoxyribonuclease [Nitrosopumilus sp. H13]|nr:MAG: TatD family deoxyribonuclease [Nitrosopumilus sp. H13]
MELVWLYDSHIHLSDPEYAPYIGDVLSGMKSLQIRACCVSMDAASSLETVSLAEQSDLVLPFVGVHPECAKEGADGVAGVIEEHPGISGIGEIGIDPSFASDDGESKGQVQVFESMLEIAERMNLPVSIHSRRSLDAVLDIMTSYGGRALLHWFDGNKKQLRRAMEMGLFVSYGPVAIYANDKQALLSRTDKSKILVETDGPVRFSRCFESKPGQPSFIPSVVFCASQILGKTFEETACLLEENTVSFLGGARV